MGREVSGTNTWQGCDHFPMSDDAYMYRRPSQLHCIGLGLGVRRIQVGILLYQILVRIEHECLDIEA